MFWDSIVFPEVLFFRSVFEGKNRDKNGLTFKWGEKQHLVDKVKNAMNLSTKLFMINGEFPTPQFF